MGLMRSLSPFSKIDRAAERILKEIDQRQSQGEQEFWVQYTQQEVSMVTSASQVASLIRRKIEKAGHEVVDGEGGNFGDDVRLLVRCGRGSP